MGDFLSLRSRIARSAGRAGQFRSKAHPALPLADLEYAEALCIQVQHPRCSIPLLNALHCLLSKKGLSTAGRVLTGHLYLCVLLPCGRGFERQSMHLQGTQVARLGYLGRCTAVGLTASTHRPRQPVFRRHRHICRAAADSKEEASDESYDDEYQLRRDFKSVTRTVFEGKPLLQEDRAQVLEEESKERFFGRLAVLSLGVSPPTPHIALPIDWQCESRTMQRGVCDMSGEVN